MIIGVNVDVLFDITSRQHTSSHVFKVLIVTGFVQQALISLKRFKKRIIHLVGTVTILSIHPD